MPSKARHSFTILFLILITVAGCNKNNITRFSGSGTTPTLLISFDGFRYDYLDRVSTPHFDSLKTAGVSAGGLISVFPTKTFPNHYSIVTGLYPEHSGLVGNVMYDPKWDEWYRISDREAVENADWYEGEPIWNTLEKQGIRTGTMFWVGSEAPIQNMRPTHWLPYDGSITPEARIDTVVKWFTHPDESQQIDFATLYFDHVDAVGHRFGIESDTLNASIRESDRLIGYLKKRLREAGLWEEMNIVIVSDHGMIDLSADRTIVLDSIINLEEVEQIIWDPVTLIWPEERKEDIIYKQLKEHEANYRVYKKEHIPERYHFKNHRRIADIIIVADPGYTILSSEYRSRFIDSLPAATHGYDHEKKPMQAFFVAAGPDFKIGERVGTFQNIHIYELLNHLMGTKPAPNNGSLDSVKVLLK